MRIIKKGLSLLLVLMLSMSLLASCGAGQGSNLKEDTVVTKDEGSGVEAGRDRESVEDFDSDLAIEDITVAYVCADLTNEVFAMQVNEMLRYSAEIGLNFLYTVAIDDAQKITAMENYINMGVNTIILNCSNPPVMVDIIDQAQAAGVKVFCYDNNGRLRLLLPPTEL